MQNKEIEKALNNLYCSITDVMFNALYSQEQMHEDIRVVLNSYKKLHNDNKQNKEYIQQLETKEQKVMKFLVECKKEYTEELKYNFTKRDARLQLLLVDKILEIMIGEE